MQTQPKGGVDLTLNKVLAGAGAAATSAVLGSFFGAAGTVTGAAFGSVASTVAATLYQQSLDRTRDKIAGRIRFTRGRGMDAVEERATEITMPMPRISPEAATTHLRVGPGVQPGVQPVVAARSPRRLFVLWSAATVLVFVLGLLAITGVEWVKGSTLTSGQSGTSVGRVIEGDHESRPKEERVEPTTTPEPTPTPTPSADPSTDPSSAPGAGQDSSGANPSNDPDDGGSATSRPAAPGGDSGDFRNDGSGNDGSGNDGSGNDGSGNGGSGNGGSANDGSGNNRSGGDSSGDNGGAVPTPLVPVPGAPGN